MPRLHISLKAGKPEAYRRTILDSLYQSMRETLTVTEDNQFMTITEHEGANFRYGNAYGVTRSDDLIYIQIILFNTRTLDQKRAFYARVAQLLGEKLGIRSDDVFINLIESPKENWSVGHGLAQFA